jgi:hypothetical protein
LVQRDAVKFRAARAGLGRLGILCPGNGLREASDEHDDDYEDGQA